METIAVLWPGKFGDRVVNINRQDFNAEVHKIPGSEPIKGSGLESKTKPELVELAKAKSIDTKDMTKAELIAALETQ